MSTEDAMRLAMSPARVIEAQHRDDYEPRRRGIVERLAQHGVVKDALAEELAADAVLYRKGGGTR